MTKSLIRIVTLLLVHCLIVNLTFASALEERQTFSQSLEGLLFGQFPGASIERSYSGTAFTSLDRSSVAASIRFGATVLLMLGLQHSPFIHSVHQTLPFLSMAFSRRDLFRYQRNAPAPEDPPPAWVLRRLGVSAKGIWNADANSRLRDLVEQSSPETIARVLRGAIPSLTLDSWNAAWDYIGLYYAPGEYLVTPVGSLSEIHGQSLGKVIARCLLEALQQQASSLQRERRSFFGKILFNFLGG